MTYDDVERVVLEALIEAFGESTTIPDARLVSQVLRDLADTGDHNADYFEAAYAPLTADGIAETWNNKGPS